MGEYRLSIYGKWQLGLSIGFEYGQVLIRIPFMDIHLALRKDAYGFCLFGWRFS